MSYIALATTTLGSSATSVTFSSIPTTVNGVALRDLIFVFNGTFTATANSFWQANGDTAANYSYVQMWGTGSGGGNTNSDAAATGGLAGANYTGRGVNIVQFMDYSATDKHKTALTRNNDGSDVVGAVASRWANTSAITSVRIFLSGASFTSGSTFSLYGIA
jgi:hypothetical protein